MQLFLIDGLLEGNGPRLLLPPGGRLVMSAPAMSGRCLTVSAPAVSDCISHAMSGRGLTEFVSVPVCLALCPAPD